jgi:hypothetical protein
MKRILIVVLAIFFALTVSGCGKGKEEGKGEKAKGYPDGKDAKGDVGNDSEQLRWAYQSIEALHESR